MASCPNNRAHGATHSGEKSSVKWVQTEFIEVSFINKAMSCFLVGERLFAVSCTVTVRRGEALPQVLREHRREQIWVFSRSSRGELLTESPGERETQTRGVSRHVLQNTLFTSRLSRRRSI